MFERVFLSVLYLVQNIEELIVMQSLPALRFQCPLGSGDQGYLMSCLHVRSFVDIHKVIGSQYSVVCNPLDVWAGFPDFFQPGLSHSFSAFSVVQTAWMMSRHQYESRHFITSRLILYVNCVTKESHWQEAIMLRISVEWKERRHISCIR